MKFPKFMAVGLVFNLACLFLGGRADAGLFNRHKAKAGCASGQCGKPVATNHAGPVPVAYPVAYAPSYPPGYAPPAHVLAPVYGAPALYAGPASPCASGRCPLPSYR